MTQPSTVHSTAAIPRQRATQAGAAGGGEDHGHPAAEPQPTGWAALRRNLAILRGLVSMRSVPARPQRGPED
ncbi:hypothetical protein C7C46_08635 [Streptomyces tateyamensis]|uniref:Uncharacterized protein n=1 Tax=Streptomyces tateyamensis TaxID=565073 RepID=A0A2V4NFB7_9ACTN|nr:hypothetical protein [Streptomyces tateyamensis]PYC83799.1 hypothetical protein C7C46_08635 [Streptomyces tateyamensis]